MFAILTKVLSNFDQDPTQFWSKSFKKHVRFSTKSFFFDYYTDSDVFLADSVDLPDIWDFLADILTFFSRWVVKLKNHTGCSGVGVCCPVIVKKHQAAQQKSPSSKFTLYNLFGVRWGTFFQLNRVEHQKLNQTQGSQNSHLGVPVYPLAA